MLVPNQPIAYRHHGSSAGWLSRYWPVLLIGAGVLPWKISVKGGACAIAVGDAPLGAPLTVSLRGDRMPGAGRTARSVVLERSSVSALERVPAVCGSGAADRRQRRARWASARRARQAADRSRRVPL